MAENRQEQIAKLDGLLSPICTENLISIIGAYRYVKNQKEVITYALGTNIQGLQGVSLLYKAMQHTLAGAHRSWYRHHFLWFKWGKPTKVIIGQSVYLQDDPEAEIQPALKLTCRIGFE